MRRLISSIIVSCIILLFISAIFYFTVFDGGLSNDSDDWGNFGDYFSLFVNLINLILLGAISFITLTVSERFNHLQLRPHVYIIEDAKINPQLPFNWSLKIVNRSNVPAINVLVRFSYVIPNNPNNSIAWTRWVACFSLGRELRQELTWVFFPTTIEVCYTDVENRSYYLHKMEGWTGQDESITRQEFERNLQNAQNTFYPASTELANTNNLTEKVLSHLAANGGNTHATFLFIINTIG